MQYINYSMLILLTFVVSACGGGSDGKGEPQVNLPQVPTVPSEPESKIKIKLNQLGYLPNAVKIAIIPNTTKTEFTLVSMPSGNVVFSGTLSAALSWPLAGDDKFKQADFSSFSTEGSYILRVNGLEDSSIIDINTNVYSALHDSTLKFYYFNRASSSIDYPYSEQWPRKAGHADDNVKVHASAANTQQPVDSILPSTKGWYDAGDYGKYVVNSGIATYTLLAAYEHFPAFYQNREINIPESGDNVPDILNEVLWNLEWLATMQSSDGGVYHKLTTLDWPGLEMPDEDTRDRYVIGKSTASALDFAAILSMASRIYQPYESTFPGKSEQWLKAAEKAWLWALENENQPYRQPLDVTSGEYGDYTFNDEFAWAASELFMTTKKVKYLEKYMETAEPPSVPSWANVSYLATSTLLLTGEADIEPSLYRNLKEAQLTLANNIVNQHKNNPYGVAMVEADFVWGSNAVVLNKALVLLQAYRLSKEAIYKQVALEHVDYILGRNPTGYSYVTGFGNKTPLFPHHRISASDGIDAPIPGMLVGGPHNGNQDGCLYPSQHSASAYLDDWCSFSTNEVAINWNAPLVYVLAALLEE